MATGAVQVETLLAGIRDSSGEPLASGKVHTYEPGTTTDKDTWTDQGKVTTAANPIILDSNGRAQIYADGEYKFVVKDSDDTLLYTWDNLVFEIPDDSNEWAGTSGGSSNAYTLTPSPAAAAYTTGDIYRFKANHTNSGSSTINISGLGNKDLKKLDLHGMPANLNLNEIVQDGVYQIIYDGTQFLLLNVAPPSFGSWSPTWAGDGSLEYNSVSGTTTWAQIGDVVTCIISVTGTTVNTGGYITMSPPVSVHTNSIGGIAGICYARDALSGSYDLAASNINDATTIAFYSSTATGDGWTPGGGRTIRAILTYQAA